MDYIRFRPIYKERVWGGRMLETRLGRMLPEDKPIGESWDIVDRDASESTVTDGEFEGMGLRELLQVHGKAIMGPHWNEKTPFPILVKWLDCRDRLSVQVHPPAEIAESLGGEPKTENWYILNAEPGSTLHAGLKHGVTPEQFETTVRSGNLEDCSHEIHTESGDSILIPSGRVHSIGGGQLILEISENSDTTYRVYDWGRVGLDGKPRELHLEKSLKCIDFTDFEPEKLAAKAKHTQILADCDSFRIQKLHLENGQILEKAAEEGPWIVSVIGGVARVKDGDRLSLGDNILLPYNGSFSLEGSSWCTILVTDHFNKL